MDPKHPVDVLLSGNFIRKMSRPSELPRERLRFWLFCEASRESAVRLLALPENATGVIPRYALFPLQAEPRPMPATGRPWTLVYCGPFSQSKNFDLLLRVVSALQTQLGEPVELACWGAFDELGREDHGAARAKGFAASTRALIASLPWNRAPSLRPLRSLDGWIREAEKHPHPVFISLSTHYQEEFGVALAQAQQRGWPAVLTHWGAHRDARGGFVRWIAPHLTGAPFESEAFVKGRAIAIAREILAGSWSSKPRAPGRPSLPSASCHPAGLAKAARKRIARWYPEGALLARSQPAAFATSPRGRLFFEEHRRIFSGRNAPKARSSGTLLSVYPPYLWASFDQVIPAIEMAWAATSSNRRRVELVRIGTQSAGPRQLRQLRSGDWVAVALANQAVCRVLREIGGARGEPRPRFLIHTHDASRIGCRTYARFGLEKLLTTRDLLIGTCNGDRASFALLYRNARTAVIPHPIPALLGIRPRPSSQKLTRIFYVGRIAEQKNLEALLKALAVLKRREPARRFRLEIFGGEHGRGNPVFGIAPSPGSLKLRLKRLGKKLGVEDHIRWRGELDIAQLLREQQEPHLFVSPSLNFDENFGVSACISLGFGNPAVLSGWGGHRELKRLYGPQVELVPVRKGTAGPELSPDKLARAIARKLALTDWKASCSAFDLLELACDRLLRASEPGVRAGTRIRRTALGEALARRIRRGEARIFLSPDDPKADPLLRAYGMR